MGQLADAAALANDPQVTEPLTAAVTRAAVAVLSEDAETEGHAQRAALARDVMSNPRAVPSRFAWAISTNDTVVDKHSAGDLEGVESDMQYVVNTVWNAVAGIDDSML